jgi:hypothetical protein
MGSLGQSRQRAGHPLAGHDQTPVAPFLTAPFLALVAAVAALVIALLFGIPRQGGGSGDFSVSRTSTSLSPSHMEVSAELTSGVPRQIRAWIYLDAPGAVQPWATYEYRSAILERELRAGEPLVLSWREPLVIRDGVYAATLWVEAYQGESWLQAATVTLEGGGLPLIVSDGNSRVRIAEGGGPGSIVAEEPVQDGDRLTVPFQWTLNDGIDEAVFAWELRPISPGGGQPFTSRPTVVGRTGDTAIASEVVLPAGLYDLWIWLRPALVGPATVLVYHDAFQSDGDSPFARRSEPNGEGTWRSTGTPLPALAPDGTSPLPLTFDPTSDGPCTAHWALRIGSTIVAQGAGGACENPSVFLPEIEPGEYQLDIGAFRPGPNGVSRQMDVVTFEATVTGR